MKVGYLFQPSLLRVLPINVIDSHMQGFGVTSRYIYILAAHRAKSHRGKIRWMSDKEQQQQQQKRLTEQIHPKIIFLTVKIIIS